MAFLADQMGPGYNPYDADFLKIVGGDTSSPYQGVLRTYNAFTGADIVAHIGNRQIGTLEQITVSVSRDTMPKYVMGRTDPVAFVRGKRAVVGSMVFSMFDRHPVLWEAFPDVMTRATDIGKTLWGLSNSNLNQFADLPGGNDGFTKSLSTPGAGFTGGGSPELLRGISDADFKAQVERNIMETYTLVANRKFKYVDQLPPFNVTVTMVNEQGASAVFTVYGVVLINEGFGYGMDDMGSNAAYSYMALSVDPLEPLYMHPASGRTV